MAKSKSKKSIASHSLRQTARSRLAARKLPVAPKANPATNVATQGQPDATETNVVNNPPEGTDEQTKKLSALSAAARVLEELGGALNCPALVAAMAAKGYWTSPGGKTPASTLNSAIMREIATKGSESRFKKTGRGLYAAASSSAT